MTDTLTTGPGTAARPAFLDGFARMHAAMRRDAARLPRAVAAASDPEALAAVARWFRCFHATLVHHHEREDHVIWPELLRRDPSFADAHADLVADHHVLDAALGAAKTALAGAGDPDATGTVHQLAGVLVDHLAREEAAAFPRLAACFTEDEWAGMERSFLKGAGLRHLAFEIPWVLDGLPDEEVAVLEAGAPRALRIVHRLAFAPRYARVAAPLLAVAR